MTPALFLLMRGLFEDRKIWVCWTAWCNQICTCRDPSHQWNRWWSQVWVPDSLGKVWRATRLKWRGESWAKHLEMKNSTDCCLALVKSHQESWTGETWIWLGCGWRHKPSIFPASSASAAWWSPRRWRVTSRASLPGWSWRCSPGPGPPSQRSSPQPWIPPAPSQNSPSSRPRPEAEFWWWDLPRLGGETETHLTNNVRSLPAKYRPVEICQRTPEFPEVIRHAETVRHCADSVLQEFEVTAELRRVVGVGDHPCSDGLTMSQTISAIPWPKECWPSLIKFRIPRTADSVRRVSSSRWTIQSSSFRMLLSSSRQNCRARALFRAPDLDL